MEPNKGERRRESDLCPPRARGAQSPPRPASAPVRAAARPPAGPARGTPRGGPRREAVYQLELIEKGHFSGVRVREHGRRSGRRGAQAGAGS